MAWTNLYKAEQDVPVGLQSVNQARDNLEYLRDSILVEHAGGAPPSTGSHVGGSRGLPIIQPPFQVSSLKKFGRHNEHRIARGVAYVSYSLGYNGVVYYPYFSWASDIFTGISRFGAGSFFVPISKMSLMWATVTVYATSNSPKRFGQVRPYYVPSGSPGAHGLFVQTYDLSVGTFDLTDNINFSITVYGKVG